MWPVPVAVGTAMIADRKALRRDVENGRAPHGSFRAIVRTSPPARSLAGVGVTWLSGFAFEIKAIATLPLP